MFGYLARAVGLTRRTRNEDGSVDITVGQGASARAINIPWSALWTCQVLRLYLHEDCNISNVDPHVFEIVIEHLTNSIINQLHPGKNDPLCKLTRSDTPFLNFAKAWHLGCVLRKPGLLRTLTRTYIRFYQKLIRDNAHVCPSSAPFLFLAEHVGWHTYAEKFLIAFFGALYCTLDWIPLEQLANLPNNIGKEIELSRNRHVNGGFKNVRLVSIGFRFEAKDLPDPLVKLHVVHQVDSPTTPTNAQEETSVTHPVIDNPPAASSDRPGNGENSDIHDQQHAFRLTTNRNGNGGFDLDSVLFPMLTASLLEAFRSDLDNEQDPETVSRSDSYQVPEDIRSIDSISSSELYSAPTP